MGIKYTIVEKLYATSPAPPILESLFSALAVGAVIDIDNLASRIINGGMELDPLNNGLLRIYVDNLQKIKHNSAGQIKLRYHST